MPSAAGDHPEEEDSPFLDNEGIDHCQHIIGVSVWLNTSDWFDLQEAISSLPWFAAKLHERHLKCMKKMGFRENSQREDILLIQGL